MGQETQHLLKKREWGENEAAIFGPRMNQSVDSVKTKIYGFLIKGIITAARKQKN